jgi:hypothetical protein
MQHLIGSSSFPSDFTGTSSHPFRAMRSILDKSLEVRYMMVMVMMIMMVVVVVVTIIIIIIIIITV